MDSYVEKLRKENLSLIILKNEKVFYESSEEGMQPLLKAINTLGLSALKGSVVVDKIVGKAAALLVSYFGAREVHCITMSVRATKVLDKQGISYFTERLIPEIMNKVGTDICPFEKTVLNEENPEKGYKRLLAKLKPRMGDPKC